MTKPLTRDEMAEMRNNLAHELLAEVAECEPVSDDSRLSYVEIQIDRDLWLRIRHCPQPPYLDALRREVPEAAAVPPLMFEGDPTNPHTWRLIDIYTGKPTPSNGYVVIPPQLREREYTGPHDDGAGHE